MKDKPIRTVDEAYEALGNTRDLPESDPERVRISEEATVVLWPTLTEWTQERVRATASPALLARIAALYSR